MKFKIGQKVYDAVDIEALSLKQVLLLEQQTADLGHPLTMSDVSRISDEINACKTARERESHPEALWITAVAIWATRNLAGEDLTFGEAIDFPLSQLTMLPDPQDRKAPVNPRKARPVSGRAAGRAR